MGVIPGKFEWHRFSEVNLADQFFNSLKEDYEEFPNWFQKKCNEGEEALVFTDEQGVGSFIYLKKEIEQIELIDRTLPTRQRIKIGTFRIAERYRKQRLGEGALGVSLWRWQEEKCEEIYLTIFEKHTELIGLFERFGFIFAGFNKRGERVYLKNRLHLNFRNPYLSFPFIRSDFERAGLIPIYESFHDRLLPYSELKGTKRIIEEETAGNGIAKVFIGTPYYAMRYSVGEPVVIYRVSEQTKGKTYRSAVTSFCTITKIDIIKDRGTERLGLAEFINIAGNKTIFTPEELTEVFSRSNVVMLEFVYNGFFGKGHNVIHKELKEQGLFDSHPYQIEYSKEQFCEILRMGDRDVHNIIID